MQRELWRHRQACWGAAGLLLLLAAAGCGGETASVSGKVIYHGEPVTAGAVTFYGADGRLDSGFIQPDGSYTVSRAPVGPVKVTVVSSRPKPPPPVKRKDPNRILLKAPSPEHPTPRLPAGAESAPSGTGPVGTTVVVPAKYKDPDQSGLAFTLRPGPQRIDLNLQN